MLSGNLTAGHKGKPILWGSLEILARVAKIVPLDERLSDMCGSVQHAKVYPFFRRARLCSPSSIDAEKDSI